MNNFAIFLGTIFATIIDPVNMFGCFLAGFNKNLKIAIFISCLWIFSLHIIILIINHPHPHNDASFNLVFPKMIAAIIFTTIINKIFRKIKKNEIKKTDNQTNKDKKLVFKSGQDALKYACQFLDTNIQINKITSGLVKNPIIQEDGTIKSEIILPCTNFIAYGCTFSERPLTDLKEEDFIAFLVSEIDNDNSMITGKIINKLKPEYDINKGGWVSFTTEELKLTSYKEGVRLAREKRFEEAIKCFEQSIAINKNIAKSYYNLGYIAFEQNDIDKAIEMLNMSLKFGRIAESYYLLGQIYENSGEEEKSYFNFKEAKIINPEFVY